MVVNSKGRQSGLGAGRGQIVGDGEIHGVAGGVNSRGRELPTSGEVPSAFARP